jgi:4-amino-4-deoxy-L-arabinose transferase-like glycosyltransferase
LYHGILERLKGRLVFTFLSLFFLGATFLWLRLDRSPPAWDDSYYLTNSLVMYDALTDGGLRGYARQFLTIMGIKPPLIAILPTPVYLIAGRKPRAALLVNLAALLILFATLYHLGQRYASRRAGAIAVCIAGTMPIVYGLSRWYLVECGLTAIVCLAIALIAGWDDSGGVWRAFLLGVTCGLGLLMKFSFPVYVLIPLLYLAVRERRALLRPNVALAFVVPAAALALPWYLFNFRHAWGIALEAGSAETGKLYRTGDILSLADLGRYFSNVFMAGPTLYFVALPLLALAFLRSVRPAGKRGLLLCALWGSPILFLAFGHYRELRYVAPLYPALALALGILADAALDKRGALAVMCLSLALTTLSMLQTSFGVFGRGRFEEWRLLFAGPRLDYARTYNRTAWPHQEILADIYRAATFQGGERKLLLLGTDNVHFNADTFGLAVVEKRLPFEVRTTAYETGLSTLIPLVDSAAYFIYEEGGGLAGPFNIRAADAVREARESGKFTELPIARKLPGGGVAHVFANVSPDRLTWTGAFLAAGMDRVADCNVTFAGKLQLTGLSMQRTPEGLEVKYRWRCLKRVDRAYWCFTHIVDGKGAIAGYLDHQILHGEPPTSQWREGDTAIEKLSFRFSGTQKSKFYRLRLGVFDRASGERLPITASDFPLSDNGTATVVSETEAVR